jgi:hypothetical protein
MTGVRITYGRIADSASPTDGGGGFGMAERVGIDRGMIERVVSIDIARGGGRYYIVT